MIRTTIVGLAMFGLVAIAGAQAPAGAPAGASGICKDGTYSMAPKKDGACGGHKGVQSWYLAAAPKHAPASMPAPKPAAAAAAMPAPRPASAPAPAMPAPKPAAATAPAPAPKAPAAAPVAAAAPAPAAKKAGPAAAAAAKPQAAGGGLGLVWVNTESNVYHCNGDTYYGRTKVGSYMSEADAKAKGAHGERGKTCAGK